MPDTHTHTTQPVSYDPDDFAYDPLDLRSAMFTAMTQEDIWDSYGLQDWIGPITGNYGPMFNIPG
jgi:hypothetical protein